jgi:3-oxoacyl-[acyl-carrier protein] reductase
LVRVTLGAIACDGMISRMKKLKCSEKIAVVTGGDSGIGKAIALALAGEGATLSIWGRSAERGEKVVAGIETAGGEAMFVSVDVSNADQVKVAYEKTIKQFGRVDILVNNAAVAQAKSIESLTQEDWDWIMAVNARGTFLCSQVIMGRMKEAKAGKIINIASGAGKYGSNAAGAHYAASKAAIICFTKCLARELAPYQINVNAISPGPIMTDLLEEVTKGDMQEFLSMIPLRRIGLPEDVSPVAVLLASDDSKFITGEIIDVNGGLFMD